MDEPVSIKPSWQKKFVNDVEGFAVHATIGGATLLFFMAVLMLVVQVYYYLKTGAWPHWVLFGVLMKDLPGPFVQWIVSPTDWLGLHKIVWWIFLECPTWLIALVLAGMWLACGGIVIIWLDALGHDSAQRRANQAGRIMDLSTLQAQQLPCTRYPAFMASPSKVSMRGEHVQTIRRSPQIVQSVHLLGNRSPQDNLSVQPDHLPLSPLRYGLEKLRYDDVVKALQATA